MSKMPCSITDGLQSDDEQVCNQPEFERDYETVDKDREFREKVTDSIIKILPDIARGLK